MYIQVYNVQVCDEGNAIDRKCGSVEAVMVRMGGLVS